MLRQLLWIFFRVFYRLEVRGRENLAKAGPAAIIAISHVSFLDAALAWAILDRDVAFAVDAAIVRRWWARWFFAMVHALPLDARRPQATRALIDVVRGGRSLVMFLESGLTATDRLKQTTLAAGFVADGAGAPVVPVRVEGLEHTPFGRLPSGEVRLRWWPKLVVTMLEPAKLAVAPGLRGEARRKAAGAALYELMSEAVFRTSFLNVTIPEALIAASRRYSAGHVVLEDSTSGKLTYRKTLAGVAILGRKLMALAPEGGVLGVMLPTSTGAALTLLGLMSAGRIPAMINFTAGARNILAACSAAGITTILTSRAFIEKAQLADLVETMAQHVKLVWLEDVRKEIGLVERLRGLIAGHRPLVRRAADDPAIILFTSGSEGTPKGVVLSHRNILTNVAQGKARFEFGTADVMLNVLPVFHSFGLTVGLILPVVSGVRAYQYPSPLHYRVIPELVRTLGATMLLGTDTFLAGYARSAELDDFRTLRLIVAGAEPVRAVTRRKYLDLFGVRILEGYGVTETAPALAFNTPVQNRDGTVGRLLPGIAARVDPVPGIEEGGRLVVHGPNVMLGYLNSGNLAEVEPPAGGWYDTGDIVSIDNDGFITVQGRARRFAKVGGEMVSLAAVESLITDLWPDSISAVTAVSHARKGEQLVLMTDYRHANRNSVLAFARKHGVSELVVPSVVMVVEALPVLGSGKIDHPAVGRKVASLIAEGAAATTD
jgi:acyl-[acyl-carrier-protein]-phospholipid O-acyltransferase/long-chain-fatty-acid--[acyl-carrier-protein] ligase